MKALWIATLLLTSLAAQAAPLRRVALVVGANHGALGRSSLRYSYSDAEQFASVLTQVGQFAPGDVRVLRDPEPQAVLDELDRELAALAAAGGESMLIFYYSGHADNAALYPDGKPLSFAQLRPRLENQAATVRIGIIDACSGGGWTGAKGIYPSAPFVVDVPLQLTSEGSVLIASSSGVEKAHESESVNGSFFTHHLVAAMRGAADQHGEGVVTLNDAFTYARERTIRDSAAVSDPQHPSFSMNLRGRSDLTLTRVTSSNTMMELTETEGPLQLIHLGTGLVVMEVPPGNRVLKLSVPSGRYLVRRQRSGGNYSREVTVEPDRSVSVDEGDLTLAPFPNRWAKGFGEPAGWPRALNDRPLALFGGMWEAQIGLLAEDDSYTFTQSGNVTAGGFGSPYTLAAQIRYGVTDRLTLAAGAPNGLCLNGTGCPLSSAGSNLSALYLISSHDLFEFAPLLSIGANGQQAFPVQAGFTARTGRGHLASFQITAQVGRVFQTQNDAAYGIFSFEGLLTVQLFEPFSIDAGMRTSNRFPFADRYSLPVTFGATYAFSSHVDARLQLALKSIAVQSPSTPGDQKQFGFSLTFRP